LQSGSALKTVYLGFRCHDIKSTKGVRWAKSDRQSDEWTAARHKKNNKKKKLFSPFLFHEKKERKKLKKEKKRNNERKTAGCCRKLENHSHFADIRNNRSFNI
jgi:hypothetical protein